MPSSYNIYILTTYIIIITTDNIIYLPKGSATFCSKFFKTKFNSDTAHENNLKSSYNYASKMHPKGDASPQRGTFTNIFFLITHNYL